jgi:glycine/D-amino acid oxidase-like deaminating enzyme
LPTSRRKFIGGLGLASTGGLITASEPAAAPAKLPAVDVLVVGGGTAGTIAAIQAARMGASTVLVEAGSQLGGTTTTAGVDFPGLFHAWGRQIIAGIGWDLVVRTVELNGDKLPDFSRPPAPGKHWQHQVRICGALYAALAEEAALQSGVRLRCYEFPTAVEFGAGRWRVSLAGKGTASELVASQIVDCTGNAAVVALAGLARQREAVVQPGTLIYKLGGYDVSQLDLKALDQAYRQALQSGHIQAADMLGGVRGFLAAHGENAMHVPGADSSTSAAHTETNVKGRQSLLRVLRFLRLQPGFENLRVERLQAETGVRETWRIVAEAEVRVADYTGGRIFADALANSFYPIDLHDEHGVKPRPLP